MNKALRRLLDGAEGRPLSDLECEQLLGYSEGLLARLELHRTLEQAEGAILSEVSAVMVQRFPEIEKYHGASGFDKTKRDLGLVYRYAVLAMVMRDPDMVNDKLAVWFRTIMAALSNLRRVHASVVVLEEAVARNVSPADAAEVLPYIRIVTRELETGLGEEPAQRAA